MNEQKPDVVSVNKAQSWFYSDVVKDHFFNPRKFMLAGDEKNFSYNGLGLVGVSGLKKQCY